MRYKEITEGTNFSACTLTPNADGKGGTLSPHNWRKEEVECDICHGAGVIDYPTMSREPISPGKYACGLCRGTGKLEDDICDGPSMDVSYMNAAVIVREIFGQEWEEGGLIDRNQLPALRKRLFKMTNMESERAAMRSEPTNEPGQMRRSKDEHGNDKIGRGATMISGGRPDDQVLRYAQTLLDMVDYAIKNDLVISWG